VLHEDLEKGYIARQDGFEIFLYTINDISGKDYKVDLASKESLVQLNNEKEYGLFKKELKKYFTIIESGLIL
jgi:hypothetical protein